MGTKTKTKTKTKIIPFKVFVNNFKNRILQDIFFKRGITWDDGTNDPACLLSGFLMFDGVNLVKTNKIRHFVKSDLPEVSFNYVLYEILDFG